MAKINDSMIDNLDKLPQSRRNFFRYAGGAGLIATVVAACQKTNPNPPGHNPGKTINLGSGDTGILNYAYTLEQLEAAFYIRVLDTPYFHISPSEYSLLSDIRDHEIAHREFSKQHWEVQLFLPSPLISAVSISQAGIVFLQQQKHLKIPAYQHTMVQAI